MRTMILIAAALMASGCDQTAEPVAPEQVQPSPMPAATATVAPIAAPPMAPLLPEQIAAVDLGGELGCSFAVPGDPGPLLIATGIVGDKVGKAQGLGASTAVPVRLQAREPGGYDAMTDGMTFIGSGHSYTVMLVTGVPSEVGGESPPKPARLDVTTADGEKVAIIGEWTCGP